jgi:hypothetical protein
MYGHAEDEQGRCYFQGDFTIQGSNGSKFSGLGDSGSVIVKENGEVTGILFAANETLTYACPIDSVFRELKCTLL